MTLREWVECESDSLVPRVAREAWETSLLESDMRTRPLGFPQTLLEIDAPAEAWRYAFRMTEELTGPFPRRTS